MKLCESNLLTCMVVRENDRPVLCSERHGFIYFMIISERRKGRIQNSETR